MKLNGEIVNLQDRVFDISVQRGFGRVIKISSNYIEVKFSNTTVRYDEDGIQLNKDWQTLFWTKPLVMIPVKSESRWHVRKELFDKFLNLVQDYKDYI